MYLQQIETFVLKLQVFYYKCIMKLLFVIEINYCSKPTIHVYHLSLFTDNYFFQKSFTQRS